MTATDLREWLKSVSITEQQLKKEMADGIGLVLAGAADERVRPLESLCTLEMLM
jgi:hypothetical protein